MPDRQHITAALESVTDPDLGEDVVSAGLVTDVTVDDGTVTLAVELAGLTADSADELVEAMRSAVLEVGGVEQVQVDDGEDETGSTPAVGLPADRVIAVASAKGGVGKSTVATSLARGLAERGEEVGLFDADIHGPNVPELLDAEGPVTATEDGRAAPVTAGGCSVMSIGLIDNDAPIAWRGAMAHEALLDLLGDTAWGDLDTLILDLPPGTGDIVLTTLQDVPVDGVVLVSTPYPTAVDDTERSATLFRENGIPILGTVVNMAGFTCPSCGDTHDVFGDGGTEMDVPVLAELPLDEDFQQPADGLPEEIDSLVAAVRERVETSGFEVPESALDVRGVPAGMRLELVTEEFDALDAGDDLTVVTDQPPDSLLAALGVGDEQPSAHNHDCSCGTGHDGSDREAPGESPGVDVKQLGADTYAVRVAKRERASAPPG